ncbi:MAG: AAA family ATPase [Myxococcota bacterium]|nr:AAA family ATPase [Myxococcota bacterium]
MERREVTARLRAAWAGAAAGRGRSVLVTGEAGLGKTHVLRRFATECEARGAAVLASELPEGGGAAPYAMWSQLVRAHAACAGEAALRDALGAGAADVARIVPELEIATSGGAGGTDARPARLRLLEALRRFLRRAAARAPVLLVLDDLQRADRPSLRALELCARELRGARVLLLGAFRRDEVMEGGHPLAATLEQLARDPADAVLPLRRLDRDGVRTLAAEHGAGALDAARLRTLCQRSGGNPLFALELLGAAAGTKRAGIGTRPVPARARRMIDGRLRRLDRGCRRMLQVAAATGPAVDPARLAALLEGEATELRDWLDEALAADLLEPLPGARRRYRFAHGLVREVLRRSLPLAERGDLLHRSPRP